MTLRSPPLADEVRWVVSALRMRYGAEPAKILLDPPTGFDWNVAWRTAEGNAVVQLLDQAIGSLPQAVVPDAFRDRLAAASQMIALENLDLTAELIRVLDALASERIEGLPFKGPVLAQAAYGDVRMRRFLDLDVLIDPDALQAALEVLRQAGYEPVISLTPRQWEAARRHEHAIGLTHDRHLLELHWTIADRAAMLPRDCRPLFERSTTVALGGRSVPTLDPIDQLTIVAIHGGRHLWARLAWICDVAEAARAPGVDAERAYNIARGVGYGRALPVSFRMAERVLGAGLPWADAVRSAASDPSVDEICDALLPLLLSPGGPQRAPAKTFARMRGRLMDRRSMALRATIRAATTPTASDWAAIRLPDALWPAYYPIRLGRLIGSYVLRDRRPGDADVISEAG